MPHLELQLDSGRNGVEMDLHQIADHMFEWEEKLSAHLGLTPADISNVKERNPFKPEFVMTGSTLTLCTAKVETEARTCCYRIQSNYSDTLDIAPNVPFSFVLALNMRQFQCLNIIFWRFDN